MEDLKVIRKKRATVHITLPPCYISNEIAGITEIFGRWKRQYVQQLQSVVVNYSDVSLKNENGIIHVNRPHVHYNVTATFELFCPNIGDITYGKINRTSKKHIGCLIEDTINVTIPLRMNPSTDLLEYLIVGQIIVFRITCFDYHRGTIRVTGEITDECFELTKNTFPMQKKHIFYTTEELETNEKISILSDNFGSNENSQILTNQLEEENTNEVQLKKSKKKKKTNEIKGEVVNTEYDSDKKNVKRKRSISETAVSSHKNKKHKREESSLLEQNIDQPTFILPTIKQELLSPTKSITHGEEKKKVTNIKSPKKKKKKKDSIRKKDRTEKKKSSQKKGFVIPSGTVLKKDKKKNVSKEINDNLSKAKRKKDKYKKSIDVSVNIKSEPYDD